MTLKELIRQAQALGEENLDKEVIMFDGPFYYTPNKLTLIGDSFPRFKDKILID